MHTAGKDIYLDIEPPDENISPPTGFQSQSRIPAPNKSSSRQDKMTQMSGEIEPVQLPMKPRISPTFDWQQPLSQAPFVLNLLKTHRNGVSIAGDTQRQMEALRPPQGHHLFFEATITVSPLLWDQTSHSDSLLPLICISASRPGSR